MNSRYELIEVLDENGRFTGLVKPRELVHKTGYWHRTVHVWVVDKTGRLLLQKRSIKKESFPCRWDISAAGHIILGDTPNIAALRELNEELGIVALENELTHLFSCKSSIVLKNGLYIDNEINEVFGLNKSVALNKVIFNREEVQEVGFFTVRELKKNIESNNQSFVPHDEEYLLLFKKLKDFYL